jgi:hypothetical protein
VTLVFDRHSISHVCLCRDCDSLIAARHASEMAPPVGSHSSSFPCRDHSKCTLSNRHILSKSRYDTPCFRAVIFACRKQTILYMGKHNFCFQVAASLTFGFPVRPATVVWFIGSESTMTISIRIRQIQTLRATFPKSPGKTTSFQVTTNFFPSPCHPTLQVISPPINRQNHIPTLQTISFSQPHPSSLSIFTIPPESDFPLNFLYFTPESSCSSSFRFPSPIRTVFPFPFIAYLSATIPTVSAALSTNLRPPALPYSAPMAVLVTVIPPTVPPHSVAHITALTQQLHISSNATSATAISN